MKKIACYRYLDKKVPSCQGRTFLVSGSSSGIGLAALRALLYKGAHVIMAVRNKQKAEGVLETLKKELGEETLDCEILTYDQSDFASIKALADTLAVRKIDGFILNSGIYYPKQGSVGQDGTSLTYYVNAIGTCLLFESLSKQHKDARYVFCGSIMNASPKNDTHAYYIKSNHDERFDEYKVSERANMNMAAYFLKQGYDCAVATPGVSATSIFTNYAPLVRRLGSVLLNLVVHKPSKACLGEVLAVTTNQKGKYLIPRVFGISGYPKIKKMPKKAYRHADDFINCLTEAGYLPF